MTDEPVPEKPKVNRFRKRYDTVRLSPEAAARQALGTLGLNAA